jgi:hypothetical protein
MLAIIRAMEEWRHFLEGAEHLFEFLARFDFVLHHRPGKSMGKSNALSRRADHGTGSDDNSNIVLLTPGLFAVRALEGLETFGEERNLLRDVRRGVRDMEPEDAVSKVVRNLKATRSRSVRSAKWNLTDGVLYFRGKIYVPDLGNSAGWGNPHGLGVRVSTGQGVGQHLMTRDPSRVM